MMQLSRKLLFVSLLLSGVACGGSTSAPTDDAGSAKAAAPGASDTGAADAAPDADAGATADAGDGSVSCPPGTAYDGENQCVGGRLVPMCCQIGGGCDSFGFCAFNDGTCTECPAAGCSACPPPGSAH